MGEIIAVVLDVHEFNLMKHDKLREAIDQIIYIHSVRNVFN